MKVKRQDYSVFWLNQQLHFSSKTVHAEIKDSKYNTSNKLTHWET